MPKTFIIPSNGSSVSVKDFAKEADAALKAHNEALDDKARREQKGELALHDAAIECAKALVKSGKFGDAHVYAVISSGANDFSWPQGSGNIVDVRIESRAQPAQPAAAPVRTQAEEILEESRRRDAMVTPVSQTVAAYAEGSRPEEIASHRDPYAQQHTIVPPATGYTTPYQPGNRPEELAARHDPSTLPQANPEETEKLAKKQRSERKSYVRSPKTKAAAKRAQQKADKENAALARPLATGGVIPTAPVVTTKAAARSARAQAARAARASAKASTAQKSNA